MTSETQAPKHLATITGIETPARTSLTADGETSPTSPRPQPPRSACSRTPSPADTSTRTTSSRPSRTPKAFADVLAAASSAVMDETEDPYDIDYSLTADNLSGAASQVRDIFHWI